MASEDDSPPPTKTPKLQEAGEADAEAGPAHQPPQASQAPSTGLTDLTEELTLELFSQLDMASLAAVRRVSRRLHRIASDVSLLGRVSVVRWISAEEDGYGPWGSYGAPRDVLLTNCVQLGAVQMPEMSEVAVEKFLRLLDWLAEGGATIVSLQTPAYIKAGDGDVLARLPALLTKRKVALDTLACSAGRFPALMELLRSQPTIAHLCVPRLVRAWNVGEAAEVVRCLPSLRHLTVVEACEDDLLAALAPQLRSLLFVVAYDAADNDENDIAAIDGMVGVIREAAGGLLFRAVGVLYQDEEGEGMFDGIHDMLFAVEGCRAEERGERFLWDEGHELWDSWSSATNLTPEPTLDYETINAFLSKEGPRQSNEDVLRDVSGDPVETPGSD